MKPDVPMTKTTDHTPEGWINAHIEMETDSYLALPADYTPPEISAEPLVDRLEAEIRFAKLASEVPSGSETVKYTMLTPTLMRKQAE